MSPKGRRSMQHYSTSRIEIVVKEKVELPKEERKKRLETLKRAAKPEAKTEAKGVETKEPHKVEAVSEATAAEKKLEATAEANAVEKAAVEKRAHKEDKIKQAAPKERKAKKGI